MRIALLRTLLLECRPLVTSMLDLLYITLLAACIVGARLLVYICERVLRTDE